jgi:hypothetical protein
MLLLVAQINELNRTGRRALSVVLVRIFTQYPVSAIEGSAPSSDEEPTLSARGKGFLKRALDALKVWLRKPTALAGAFGFTFGHMLCTFLSLSILLSAMGEDVPLYLIAGLWSVAYFVTLIPVSINGYGVQELSLVWLFTSVAGVSLAEGLLMALLMRVLTVAASLPGAVYLPSVLAAMDRSKAWAKAAPSSRPSARSGGLWPCAPSC